MKLLFYFVHPSKFYVFRNTINYLKSHGHDVEIIITSKDVLEPLVKSEGWLYTNIFPKGRKIRGVSPLISAFLNFFRTIHRLYKIIKRKNFDLYVTDDLVVFLSKLLKTPSIVFTDDDLSVTRKFSLILSQATYILAPNITNLEKYNEKKIGFDSYKELAYLHPRIFTPNIEFVKEFNPSLEKYCIIRLVSLKAYHDVGIKGLTNENVKKIIDLLESKQRVFISSERDLPEILEKYRLKIQYEKIAHAIFFANLFIGDSQTMTSEAAVLGTPAFRCNDFVGKISVMDEKETKYGLSLNFHSRDFEKMYQKIVEVISNDVNKSEYIIKRNRMLSEKINLTEFMIWLLENYPHSVEQYKMNPKIQHRFL